MSERDYRTMFVRDIESELIDLLDSDQIQAVSAAVVRVLSDYEITERCTQIVPTTSQNETLCRRYLACLLVDGKSKNTVYQYGRHLARLSEAVRKDYTEMTAYDIRYYLACRKESGLKNRSLDNIGKNPMATIKPIKCTREVRKPFSDVEIDALRSACRTPKERALIEFLLSSGVRVSELSGMDVSDIDMTGMTVHVRHGKGDKERMTYINPVTVLHLKKYLLARPEEGEALFYNKNHNRLEVGGVRHILHSLAERAGVENCHPHRFRRTLATGLAARGMEIQEIQRVLGHSDIKTTMQYIAVDDGRVKASYRKYSA